MKQNICPYRHIPGVNPTAPRMHVPVHTHPISPHLHAQEARHLPHPLAVTASQVVIDCHHVHTLARQRIQVGGQHCNKRLALTWGGEWDSGSESESGSEREE